MAKGQPHSSSKKKYPVPRDKVVDVSMGHFFMTPNALIQRFAAAMKPNGVSVYMALKTFTTDDDPSCFPSYHTIAKMTGISRRQVLRTTERLEALGLVAVRHRRRTDTNIYILLPLPPASDTDTPASDSQSLVKPSASDSQSLEKPSASDSQSLELVTNSHQASDSQSPKEYPPKNTHLKKTHPTPTPTPPADIMAPKSTDVVEVADDFAVAPGEEAKATDGDMASAGVPLWQQFCDVYQCYRFPERVEAEWNRWHCDAATLQTIIAKLPWQRKLTGRQQLPDFAHIYLKDRRWMDPQPASPSARENREWDNPAGRTVADATPRTCRYDEGPLAWQKCHDPVGDISNKFCDVHARERIHEEARQLHELLLGFSPWDPDNCEQMNNMEAGLSGVIAGGKFHQPHVTPEVVFQLRRLMDKHPDFSEVSVDEVAKAIEGVVSMCTWEDRESGRADQHVYQHGDLLPDGTRLSTVH